MATTIARQQAPTAMRPTTLCYFWCLFFLFITVVTMNTPALAGDSSPPCTLVVYVHRKNLPPNATIVEVASPSGTPVTQFPGDFGTTFVIEDILRETEAPDSPIIGSNDGLIVAEKDNFLYASITFVLNINGYSGTIALQGVTKLTEELAITGGTQDFRFARGYAVPTFLVLSPEVTVFRVDLTIRYD